ncbi:hypothetical protein CEXT_567981 [Caerostris extrusa]|uniref:Uncharacterized protein n=1 Tax=Caerostris extrusa TaxID=172846 RepID=A0AAV4PZ08_CAEEX|nr:hypothetical protein CEXT_567981 [Caerostris extrusa]
MKCYGVRYKDGREVLEVVCFYFPLSRKWLGTNEVVENLTLFGMKRGFLSPMMLCVDKITHARDTVKNWHIQLNSFINLQLSSAVLPTDKTISGSEQNNLLYSDISVNPPHPLSSKQQKPNLLLHKRQHTMEANLSNCPTKRKNGPALSRKSHLAGRWP